MAQVAEINPAPPRTHLPASKQGDAFKPSDSTIGKITSLLKISCWLPPIGSMPTVGRAVVTCFWGHRQDMEARTLLIRGEVALEERQLALSPYPRP